MAILDDVLTPPVRLRELDHKPGRHTVWRATGSDGSAILTLYTSERAHAMADRKALAAGPSGLRLPSVLLVDNDTEAVVPSDVPRTPLREGVLTGDLQACERAGAALGRWHAG